MNYTKNIGVFFFLLCILSCKKQVENERPEFIGTWEWNCSDFYIDIIISEDSHAIYEETSYSGGTTKVKGLARATDDKLKIGRFYHFNIIEYPHKVDTPNLLNRIYWQMTLSEIKPGLYLSGDKTFRRDN
ncbi:MAG: hypothetical protein ABIJ97_00320 [Bacteroidota bacterium]